MPAEVSIAPRASARPGARPAPRATCCRPARPLGPLGPLAPARARPASQWPVARLSAPRLLARQTARQQIDSIIIGSPARSRTNCIEPLRRICHCGWGLGGAGGRVGGGGGAKLVPGRNPSSPAPRQTPVSAGRPESAGQARARRRGGVREAGPPERHQCNCATTNKSGRGAARACSLSSGVITNRASGWPAASLPAGTGAHR